MRNSYLFWFLFSLTFVVAYTSYSDYLAKNSLDFAPEEIEVEISCQSPYIKEVQKTAESELRYYGFVSTAFITGKEQRKANEACFSELERIKNDIKINDANTLGKPRPWQFELLNQAKARARGDCDTQREIVMSRLICENPSLCGPPNSENSEACKPEKGSLEENCFTFGEFQEYGFIIQCYYYCQASATGKVEAFCPLLPDLDGELSSGGIGV